MEDRYVVAEVWFSSGLVYRSRDTFQVDNHFKIRFKIRLSS